MQRQQALNLLKCLASFGPKSSIEIKKSDQYMQIH